MKKKEYLWKIIIKIVMETDVALLEFKLIFMRMNIDLRILF